ncbi:TPA: hypothetical protein UM350_001091 [Stenotrophomonas maltophilia]|uniref:AbiTii domain-containing protein n=1 Tax=Stenotrophomonas maltophilia TaxID=40324 RepID=UPI001AAFD13B|nr:hypothetical protein [Stenotrophomonas maltophilia]MBN5121060.1 hypothetical protein [Stenotrophomonas maltophilia]MBO3002855.1 hypothetical protein [Stenotrophomonas maltophilia]MBP1381310.1 hypothetical protein [Stenotrophomonas maltophilia]MBP1385554.1 hypothetical protein [Stenotrophomonas maltophilia]HEL4106455.1 hypothetical protein [Stenotrophomonas maltophilia]
MSSLVQEIQRDALDPAVGVSDLLRKALVVSTKLKITVDTAWIKSELSGYGGDVELPKYRELRGIPQVHNPRHGYMPLQMPPEMELEFCRLPMGFSVAEVESLLQQNEGLLRFTFPAPVTAHFLKHMEVKMQPSLAISPSVFHGVLDTVRNRVLQWALDLEGAGVVGDGMSFSPTDVKAAQHVTTITNNIGSMHNSQLQQLSSGQQSYQIAESREELSALLKEIRRAAESKGGAGQVLVDVDTVLVQLQSAEPKRGIVEESLRSLRTVLEGAAGGALTAYVPKLIALMAAIGMG